MAEQSKVAKFCAHCGTETLSINWCAVDTPAGRLWFCCPAHRQAWEHEVEEA